MTGFTGVSVVLMVSALVLVKKDQERFARYSGAAPEEQFKSVQNGVISIRCADPLTGQTYEPPIRDIEELVERQKSGCTPELSHP